MNAGLPGTGIGGLFYIAGALLMPLRILRDARRKRRQTPSSSPTTHTPSARGPRIRPLQQLAIAAGILASLFATGWLLGLLLPPEIIRPRLGGPLVLHEVRNVVRWASLAGTGGILFLVLATVEVATFLTRRPRQQGVERSRPSVAHARARSGSDLSKVA